jgi:hypothetical protein
LEVKSVRRRLAPFSFLAKELDQEHVRARYAQFNALDRAANLLIEKTRSDAR